MAILGTRHNMNIVLRPNIHNRTEACHIKGHGNEADFPRFLHESVWRWSLTLHFEPFWFWLRIHEDIRNRKTTPRLGESESRLLNVSKKSPLFGESESRRLPDLASRGISLRIRSQNRNGSKGSVKDLWGTNFCKTPENPPYWHVPLNERQWTTKQRSRFYFRIWRKVILWPK
jgi:hypothetical protein